MSDNTLTAEELVERLLYTVEIRTRHHANVNDPIAKESREAADMLKAQAAEIERLTRERDELRSLSPALYRSRAAAAEAKVAALERALEEIRDHSANQDMNHKDFRVAAYHAADAALGAKP